MKRLLGLVAIVALVATVMPGTGIAGLRGGFDPIGRGDLAPDPAVGGDGIPFGNGLANGEQTPSPRPVPFGLGNTVAKLERWVTFTTRDQVFGFEGSREIWQLFNRTSSPLLVLSISDARSRIFGDPTGVVSYIDPCWSPDGKWLAYVITDSRVLSSSIVVQQFTPSTNMLTSITPVAGPITVVPNTPGVRNRHPDWSPDGNRLVFDSDVSGTSIDIYTVDVFPTIGTPVRHTFVGNRAEQNPAWAPDGVRVAYDTNRFGPNIIEILDTNTNAVTLAETNFATVSHSHPDWSSTGQDIYYDAPAAEDSQQNQDIWKLTLATQSKCAIHLDGAGDVNVRVSPYQNLTNEGIPYNVIYFESQAFSGSLGSPGLILWRGNSIQTCVPPLPMAIDVKPNAVDSDAGGAGQDTTGNGGSSGNSKDISVTMSFPPETQAAGYICNELNYPGKEGVRMRTGGILPSPTFLGLNATVNEHTGLPVFSSTGAGSGNEQIVVKFGLRRVAARMVALGLVNKTVPVEVDAYSNVVGRQFRGFGLFRVNDVSAAASAVRLEQNAPNPFNPVTKIRFAVSKDSKVALRVYNVRGQLVKTLVNERMSQGMHEVNWDGRDASGSHVGSGVYYAKVSSDASKDIIKMVMAK